MEYMIVWPQERVVKPKQLPIYIICIVHETAALYVSNACRMKAVWVFRFSVWKQHHVDVSLGFFCSRSFSSESVTVWHCLQYYCTRQTYKKPQGNQQQSPNRPKCDISMYILHVCHLMSAYFSPVQRISRQLSWQSGGLQLEISN